jgi:hypothetical protein
MDMFCQLESAKGAMSRMVGRDKERSADKASGDHFKFQPLHSPIQAFQVQACSWNFAEAELRPEVL